MLHALASLPRRLRWSLQRWSSADDRDFHDALFRVQQYEPFSFAYPGYITIRRFAELTERHLAGAHHAVDLGCGPGEITCELARRNPSITFTGIDHSQAAVERADRHRRTLSLTNVAFERGDISTMSVEPGAVVMMFDSFHHLLDPAAFVRRLRANVSRFVLVEPAGDWLGGWQRTLDFDWIVPSIDAVRARLAWQMNAREERRTAGHQTEAGGAPVEHRYPLSDFVSFFEGYGLDVQGTIAGIDEYPPDPYSALPLREEFGEVAYNALVGVEDVLRRQNLDLHAKHWVIRAERGAAHSLRTPRPVSPRTDTAPDRLTGPHDVEFLAYDGPRSGAPRTSFPASLTIRNHGWRPWRSDSDPPVFVSYHWLTREGASAIAEGVRSPLPRVLDPGETLSCTCRVETPPEPGDYQLAFDLVEEGVTWFSDAGAPLYRVLFSVRR